MNSTCRVIEALGDAPVHTASSQRRSFATEIAMGSGDLVVSRFQNEHAACGTVRVRTIGIPQTVDDSVDRPIASAQESVSGQAFGTVLDVHL